MKPLALTALCAILIGMAFSTAFGTWVALNLR